VPGRVRAEPERTCIGCRAPGPSSTFVRIARDPLDGTLHLGAAPGRGAHVHRTRACVERAIRPAVLARALRGGLAPDEVGRLRERIEGELGSA
jgi:uncharacterized protein